jgi:hypothetical protein
LERGWLLDCARGVDFVRSSAGFFADGASTFLASGLTTGAVSLVDPAPSLDFSEGVSVPSFFISCDAETLFVAAAGDGSEIVADVSAVVIPTVLAALELRLTET